MVYVYGIFFLIGMVILVRSCLWKEKDKIISDYEAGEKKGILKYCYETAVFLYFNVFRRWIDEEKLCREQREIQVGTKEQLLHKVRIRYITALMYGFLCFLLLQGLGGIYELSILIPQNVQDTVLERDRYDGDVKEYVLRAETEFGTEEIPVTVNPREYTKKQLDQLYEDGFSYAWKKVLGENKEFTKVSHKLNLISEIPDSPLKISWCWEEEDYVDEEGNLIPDAIGDEAITTLYLELKYKEDVREQSVPVVFVKPKYTKKETLVNRIAAEIKKLEQEEIHKPDLSIPSNIAGANVTLPKEKSNYYFLFLSILLPFLCWLKKRQDVEEEKKEKQRQLALGYPDIVNKLVLYLGAGMTIKASFIQLVEDENVQKDNLQEKKKKTDYLYQELYAMVQELYAGQSELHCYERMGKKLGTSQYLKLTTLLTQNLSKGSKGLLNLLQNEVQDAFRERKEYAKKCGEEAGTKLLFPMLLLLIVVMIIIMIPAFMNFGI